MDQKNPLKEALSFTFKAGILVAILDGIGIKLDWEQGLGTAALALIPLLAIVGWETYRELKRTRRPK